MALLMPPGIASTLENSASASTATLGAVEGPPAGIFADFAADFVAGSFDSRDAGSCDSSELSEMSEPSESSTVSAASASLASSITSASSVTSSRGAAATSCSASLSVRLSRL